MLTHLDINTLILLVAAALNAFTAFWSHRANKNIALVEKATNSMKDALVTSTAKASLAEGTAIGRKEVTDEMKAKENK